MEITEKQLSEIRDEIYMEAKKLSFNVEELDLITTTCNRFRDKILFTQKQ